MAHRSRLAGFIIDCQTDDLDAAAAFWSQRARRDASPTRMPATAPANTQMFGDTPGRPAYRGAEGRPSLARAPGHRERRHRRRSRSPGEAGREADRFREALVGDGSADRSALLRGEDAPPGNRRRAEPVGLKRPARRGPCAALARPALNAACRRRRRDCDRRSWPGTGPGRRARTPLQVCPRPDARRQCRSTRRSGTASSLPSPARAVRSATSKPASSRVCGRTTRNSSPP